MEPMITAAPVLRGAILHARDSSTSRSSGSLETCGYLSGDYGMIQRIHSVPPSIFLLGRPRLQMKFLVTNGRLHY